MLGGLAAVAYELDAVEVGLGAVTAVPVLEAILGMPVALKPGGFLGRRVGPGEW